MLHYLLLTLYDIVRCTHSVDGEINNDLYRRSTSINECLVIEFYQMFR